MDSSLGTVTIDCPTCHRRVNLPIIIGDCGENHPGALCIGQIEVDDASVYAHVLTHFQHDGDPVEAAA